MPYITVGKENSGDVELYYKDWGSGRAALAWAEAVTRLRDQQVSDEEYEDAKRQFRKRN